MKRKEKREAHIKKYREARKERLRLRNILIRPGDPRLSLKSEMITSLSEGLQVLEEIKNVTGVDGREVRFIAAPQIGIFKRVLRLNFGHSLVYTCINPKIYPGVISQRKPNKGSRRLAIIDVKVINRSEKSILFPEYEGSDQERYYRIFLEYTDINWVVKRVFLSGQDAYIVQQLCDQLDGKTPNYLIERSRFLA